MLLINAFCLSIYISFVIMLVPNNIYQTLTYVKSNNRTTQFATNLIHINLCK